MVTYRLMAGMLSVKNQKYPTQTAWNNHLEGLYHLQIGTSLSTFQDCYELTVRMRHVPGEMVQAPGLMDHALEALESLLMHPHFDEKSLAQEKRFLKDEWATKKASKGFQAIRHLTEAMLLDHPYYVPQVQDDAAIDAVTLPMIKDAHARFMAAPRVLIRLGQSDPLVGPDFLKRLQKPSSPLAFETPYRHTYTSVSMAPVEDAMKQTLMYDMYETHVMREDEDYEALMIFNQLLGGDSESMLFKTIRETHNMAYSVGSMLLSQYGLLLINGAISPANQTAYLNEIQTILSALKTGDYPDEALALAKKSQIETIKRNHDAKGALTRRAFYSVYADEPFTKDELIRRLFAIDKAAITRIAERLTPVTSFQYGATL